MIGNFYDGDSDNNSRGKYDSRINLCRLVQQKNKRLHKQRQLEIKCGSPQKNTS